MLNYRLANTFNLYFLKELMSYVTIMLEPKRLENST